MLFFDQDFVVSNNTDWSDIYVFNY
jgi:hypothetical protein